MMIGVFIVASLLVQCHVLVLGRTTHTRNLPVDDELLPPTAPIDKSNHEKSDYLDCMKCFGHGVYFTADPRCKYGCGRVMTYPIENHDGSNNFQQFTVSTEFDLTNTPTMPANLLGAPADLLAGTELAANQEETENKAKSGFLARVLTWKGMLGLGVLLVVSISLIVYAVYKNRTKKTAPENLTTLSWAKSTETIVTEI